MACYPEFDAQMSAGPCILVTNRVPEIWIFGFWKYNGYIVLWLFIIFFYIFVYNQAVESHCSFFGSFQVPENVIFGNPDTSLVVPSLVSL